MSIRGSYGHGSLRVLLPRPKVWCTGSHGLRTCVSLCLQRAQNVARSCHSNGVCCGLRWAVSCTRSLWATMHCPDTPRGLRKHWSLSCVQLSANPWTVAFQTPLARKFSRQEYRSGLSFPSPGHLPDQGIEPTSPALQADVLQFEPPGKPGILKRGC